MTPQKTDFLPTETHHFKVRHNPVVGGVLLGIGLINLLLIVWVMLLSGEFNSGIVMGLVCTVVGVLYLTRPYFAIAPNRLTIYNLIGSTVKRYPFATFADITVNGNKIVIRTENGQPTETAKITKWLTHPKDWEAVKNMVNQRP